MAKDKFEEFVKILDSAVKSRGDKVDIDVKELFQVRGERENVN